MDRRIICLVVLLGHYGGEATTPSLTTAPPSTSDDLLTTRPPPYSTAPTSTSYLITSSVPLTTAEPCKKVSGKDLTELFNSPVYKAEWMVRPLEDLPVIVGPIAHSGVRVTLCDKSQWLIHNVAGKGTRVTSASNMSDKWSLILCSKNFNGKVTVSDLVKAGGETYNVLFNNCHLSSINIILQ